ncbi:GAF domain-containing protein [Methylocystis sp. Sn-Cys]|nr:GAF domain-containing protein [Methylocystis sp. Sn-Cys]
MLAATIEMLAADMGNVQILQPERGILTIAVQQGFDPEFLDFFAEVSADDDSACGRALRTRERVVVADVETEPAFAPYRDIARAAGFRAVQSTPLLSHDGTPLGIISTHFRWPRCLSEQEHYCLDLYARLAVNFIERFHYEERLRQRADELSAILDALYQKNWGAVTLPTTSSPPHAAPCLLQRQSRRPAPDPRRPMS